MYRLIRLGLVVAVLSAACGTDEGAVTTTSVVTTTSSTAATTTTTSSTTTTTTQVPSDPTIEWELVTFDGVSGPLRRSVDHVTAGDGRFLVLNPGLEALNLEGVPIDADGDPRTILWTSFDGLAWESHVVDVAESRRAFVLGEIDGRMLIQVWPGEQIVYWSDDLTTWTPLDFPDLTYEVDGQDFEWHPFELTPLVATDDAIVLRGIDGQIVRADTTLTDFDLVDAPFGVDPTSGYPVNALQIAATNDRFYALVYSNELGETTVWSSRNGVEWGKESVDGEPIVVGDGRITVGGEMVIVVDGESRRWYLSVAGSQFEPVEAVSLESGSEGDLNLVGGSDGFLLLGAFGFGEDAGIRSLGPWLSLDGRSWTWTPINGATAEAWTAAMVGDAILIPTGAWVVEFDGDGNIWSEDWVPDGGWVVGRVIPAG